VAEQDPRSLRVVSRWPLAPCKEPTGMAVDRKHRRLFVGCASKLMAVVDADRGKVITTLPIGAGMDACAFDPRFPLAFSSNRDGTLTVIRQDAPDRYSVAGTVETARGARNMTLDPRTHRIYLVTAEMGPPPSPTPENPHPRPSVQPGTFRLLVVDRE
jgi:hypothetical protein